MLNPKHKSVNPAAIKKTRNTNSKRRLRVVAVGEGMERAINSRYFVSLTMVVCEAIRIHDAAILSVQSSTTLRA